MTGRRTLTDSEARWEALGVIDDAVNDMLGAGAVSSRGEDRGWTDDDVRAVEQHARDRVDGLLRRARGPGR